MPDPFIPPEGGVIPNISERLSNNNTSNEQKVETVKTETTAPFDLGNLTREQLQMLKIALNATPDKVDRNKGKMTTQLRMVDGLPVIDWTSSYKAVARDVDAMRDVYVDKIKVMLLDATEWKEMLLSDFHQSDRKTFTILGSRHEPNPIVDELNPEVVHRETGALVENVVMMSKDFFTVDIDGRKVEIKSKASNA